MNLLVRIAMLLVPLAAAVAVMAAGPEPDDATNNWSEEIPLDEAEEAFEGMSNAAADAGETDGEGSGLNLRQERHIRVGKCDKAAWRIRDGAQERLRCDSLQLTYFPRNEHPGYDTSIVLQRGSDRVLWLGSNWTSREALAVTALQWEGGDWILVQGQCTGRFDRPSEAVLTGGSTLTFEVDGKNPRASFACTGLVDAAGKSLASFTFTSD